jgi:hypothetical protein
VLGDERFHLLAEREAAQAQQVQSDTLFLVRISSASVIGALVEPK